MTWDGTAEPVSRDLIVRRELGNEREYSFSPFS